MAANDLNDLFHPWPFGYIGGLLLSNNATDAVNDIDISAGTCRSGDDTANLTRSAVLTKQLDAAWVVGTAAGGRDTGAIADGWWYVWLIKRPDTGVTDALFSLSATAPTMPTNYTLKRRIGAIFRTGGAILAFVQYGDRFEWKQSQVDAATITISTAATSVTLTAPTGIRIIAHCSVAMQHATANPVVWVYGSEHTDAAPSIAAAPGFTMRVPNLTTVSATSGYADVPTATGVVRARSSLTATSFYMATRGWTDFRGKDGLA